LIDILDRVDCIRRYYVSPQYAELLEQLDIAMQLDDTIMIESILDKFPTPEQLLDRLIEFLKTKHCNSVYKTIKRIAQNPDINKYEYIKCFSSLISHAAIECSNGNTEYELVIHDLYNKLSKVLL